MIRNSSDSSNLERKPERDNWILFHAQKGSESSFPNLYWGFHSQAGIQNICNENA